MKRNLIVIFCMVTLFGCSTPSYYTYEGESESWTGTLEFKVNETANETLVYVELKYNGVEQKKPTKITYQFDISEGNEIAHTQSLSKDFSVANSFEKIPIPKHFPKEYIIIIVTDEYQETITLKCKRLMD